MRDQLTTLPRPVKRILLLAFDLLAISLSLWLSLAIRLGTNGVASDINDHFLLFILLPLCIIPYGLQNRLYNSVTRYSGKEVGGSVTRSIFYGLLTFIVIYFLLPSKPFLPRSVPIIFLTLSSLSMAGGRLIVGSWLSGNSLKSIVLDLIGIHHTPINRGTPVAIYGAGAAGRQLQAALVSGTRLRPTAFIDDNASLRRTSVSNLRVYSPSEIDKLIRKTGAEEILLAIPSATQQQRKKIIAHLEPYDLHVRTVPGLEEIVHEGIQIQQLKEVAVADILGREAVPPNPSLLAKCITGKSILVTGAGGSIGSELCRQILHLDPKRLVLFENSEYNLYRIHSELEELCSHIKSSAEIIPVLGSVTQPWRLLEVMRKFHTQSVYHAAAYKHVPIVEYNSHHGFRNNVLGTLYTAQASVITGVEHFVLVSTDKAVRPTNIMGATKRMAELVLQAISEEELLPIMNAAFYGLEDGTTITNNTNFTMVRFGNVLDSSGSVVPRFRKQIRDGGPVTVTHPEIIRYFMTIPEAAQLVIQAGSMGQGGDVFVLDMGEPVKIAQLATQLIHLSGLTIKDIDTPYGDIEIAYTGLRPGEKLYEELLIGDNVHATEHAKIMRANEAVIPWKELTALIKRILVDYEKHNHAEIRQQLQIDAIGYNPQDEISDWFYSEASKNL